MIQTRMGVKQGAPERALEHAAQLLRLLPVVDRCAATSTVQRCASPPMFMAK